MRYKSGVCLLVVPHTTAAITINSGLDPATVQDLVEDVRRLVPTRTDFHHIVDTPSDAAAHIKASLVGNSETVLIEDGDLVLVILSRCCSSILMARDSGGSWSRSSKGELTERGSRG